MRLCARGGEDADVRGGGRKTRGARLRGWREVRALDLLAFALEQVEQFLAGADGAFAVDVLDVGFYRAGGDEQRIGDIGKAAAAHEVSNCWQSIFCGASGSGFAFVRSF